ncbi:RSP_2647 family RNA methyltransferase [Salipiger marinus]|jgi:23S rRNA (cytosine1962-C5)-methyltransferase|uniref:RSP_2647 family RNA methyltransferase n=1 Tax=Salipiger marinus TaxID=555512 RepID=UPI000E8B2D2C|nr:class I SAM-dependent rRNA methyltransferase [Salipiger manganoxidans]MCD1620077.1 class I SAM-dependent rRNA methyltransferase [Salipiger manganoxidans]MEB3420421.1 class I SAM-dependent rRNA methyltransferase [Salipiger manganoxidans]HBM58800.1 RlmI/RlmK family 23S rRNA methyltransferase [Citreicella sp.]
MTDADFPVIRLLPKAKPQAIRRGYPWIYANELVMDRRSRGIPAGTVVRLEDAERGVLGLVGFNADSKIAGRMLDPDPEAVIGRDWLVAKLARALALRTRLFDRPYYRLVHAEADGLPGVIIDRFGDVAVIQPNAAWAEVLLADLASALAEVTGVTTILKNAGGRGRALEGLDDADAVLLGEAPAAPLPVEMNGATYMADLTGGQKTGLFYDQRPNHAFAARLAEGQQVLDVFSHVGGFALAALAQGAQAALAVDGSAAALDLARDGAARMGAQDRFATRQGDAFDVLTAMGQEEARFGLVVCDPPAFAPSKPALEAGLRAYERVARLSAGLVEEGGYLVLCSCSHAADLSSFTGACLRGIGRAGRRAQLLHTGFAGPDHPLLPQLAESGYLKALVFRL